MLEGPQNSFMLKTLPEEPERSYQSALVCSQGFL
jgi:hypothetical protein